jgi:hypothetical protein
MFDSAWGTVFHSRVHGVIAGGAERSDMSQSSGFDFSKMSTADKIVGVSGLVYFIWSLLPFWYTISVAGLGSDSVSGFRSFTLIAALLGLVAAAEVLIRNMGNKLNLPIATGLLHLVIGGIALVCTLLGFVVRPGVPGFHYGIGFGLIVGLVIAVAWAYGAYMMYSQPADAGSTGGGPMPPPPGGGGFTG